jgi:hypothetical protein
VKCQRQTNRDEVGAPIGRDRHCQMPCITGVTCRRPCQTSGDPSLTVVGLFSLAEARFLPSPPGKLLERYPGAFLLR